MAAGAWAVYNESKKKIGNGTISLASTVYRMTLHTSASNANTATLSIYNELDNQVTEANGYSSSGKAMTGEVWTVGASAGQYKFDMDDTFWSANGGAISNIKFAALWLSAAASANRHLLCRSQLSTAQFSISSGNRLTIAMNASGVLTLT
jgi:hypothetical protein